MKNVIITGGTGFIGSWLAQELIESNINITLVVRDKKKVLFDIANSLRCTIIEKDILALSKNDFSNDIKYDVFFHLAWEGVSPSKKNSFSIQLENIAISIRTLELSNEIGCEKFIGAGTVAEYVFSTNVMDMNMRQTPNDMYGAAKTSSHYFLEVRARQLNSNFIWAVIPSTFGERRTGDNIITYTIRCLLNGEKPLYGDLTQMWDFLYVGDVAKALRLIGEKGVAGKVYGIGSGKFKRLKEYILEIRDIINPNSELGIGDIVEESEKTFNSCVNIYDLVADTGFSPEISFKEGIVRTIEYMKCNK